MLIFVIMTNYKMKNGSTSIEKIFENCETEYYKINSISGNSCTKMVSLALCLTNHYHNLIYQKPFLKITGINFEKLNLNYYLLYYKLMLSF